MKTTVSVYDFRDAFQRAGRQTHFSYDGLAILFDYLEEYEAGTGEEMELDVIALCCDFAEDDPRSIAENYGIDNKGMDDDETADAVRDYLENEGAYIGATESGDFVYRQI